MLIMDLLGSSGPSAIALSAGYEVGGGNVPQWAAKNRKWLRCRASKWTGGTL